MFRTISATAIILGLMMLVAVNVIHRPSPQMAVKSSISERDCYYSEYHSGVYRISAVFPLGVFAKNIHRDSKDSKDIYILYSTLKAGLEPIDCAAVLGSEIL